MNRAIVDQFDESIRRYRRPPAHVGGHLHLHQNLTVLLSPALPHGTKMRPSFACARGEKPGLNRAVRASINRFARSRFPGPKCFVSIRSVHPALGGSGFERLDVSQDGVLEVMTRPGRADELGVLMSDQWRTVIERHAVMSYRER